VNLSDIHKLFENNQRTREVFDPFAWSEGFKNLSQIHIKEFHKVFCNGFQDSPMGLLDRRERDYNLGVGHRRIY
jgi:hypothetical protein